MEHKEQLLETQDLQASSEEVTNVLPEAAEEMHALPDEDYSQLDKQDIVNTLDKFLASGDMPAISRQVKMLKDHFAELTREEYTEKLSRYVEEGGDKEDFTPAKSSDEQRFEELLKKYNKQKAEQGMLREKKLTENLHRKQQLIAEVKKIADNAGAAAQNFKRIQEIQASWKEIGQVPAPQADSLWKTYKANIDRYFDLLHLNNEMRELNFKRNLEQKTELCEKAEKLADEPSLRKALETLHTLQEHWRETGFVGKDHNDAILERFKAAESKIAARKKEQHEKGLVQQEENLKNKKVLCEELQVLNTLPRKSHKEWQAAGQQLEQLWERWRKIGPVPESDKDNCWKLFKRLRQEFYHMKDAFYVEIREGQTANLTLRIALCEKAEALQADTDWEKTANTLKRLQNEWKTLGPVPRHKGDKVWNRFRTACDAFFNNRKQHMADMDAELEQHAAARRAIIAQINELAVAADANQSIAALRVLQDSWMQTGKAPEASFKQLNQAYKEALEGKMQLIQRSSGIDNGSFSQMRYDHLLQTSEGRNELHKERNALADRVKKLRHDIATQENNLSFFGKSKGAAALLAEYTQKIEEMKVELKTLEKKFKTMPVV